MRVEKPDKMPAKSTAARQQRSSHNPRTATNPGPLVEVYAKAGTPGRNNWCLLLNVTDSGGHRVPLRLPRSQIRDERQVVSFLEGHGVELPADPSEVVRLIQQARPKRFVKVVYRPGWHARQFLLGDKTLGEGSEKLMLDDRLDAHLARVREQGSLDDWKNKIAVRCTTSSYLVFGLAIGFSAPLLQLASVESELTNVESGGFHFWVRSTRGKTTLQRCVASIFGKGTKDGDGYVRSWKTTTAAIEETALGHCDLPLILDEMKLLAADQRKAAQLASDVAYTIADGMIKARSVVFTGPIPGDARQFRALIVSSGEISLRAQASEGHTDRLEGEAVRLIDIPVPSRSTGIFDRLPKGATAEDSLPLAEALEQASATYYGVAGKDFIEKLVRDLRKDYDGLIHRLQGRIDRFLTKSGVDLNEGYEVRFAKRFALAYAAGLLAIDYGVVPWDQRIVYRSILRVYRKARSQTTRPVDPVQVATNAVVRRVREEPAFDLTKTTGKIDPLQLESARVLLIRKRGLLLLAVRRDYFASLVDPPISPAKVAKELERKGLLIPRSKKCRTLQVPVPGVKERRGYYCLRLADSAASSPKGRSKDASSKT